MLTMAAAESTKGIGSRSGPRGGLSVMLFPAGPKICAAAYPAGLVHHSGKEEGDSAYIDGPYTSKLLNNNRSIWIVY